MTRADVMAQSMHAKDTISFCKNVYKLYKKVIPNASNVNGANDPIALSAMWKTHVESLLNNVTTDANMQNVKECVQNTETLCYCNKIVIHNTLYGAKCIDMLKSGKACGNLADDFMKTFIIPMVKKSMKTRAM